MYLITVQQLKEQLQLCVEFVEQGNRDIIMDAITHLLPETLDSQDSLARVLARNVNLRSIDILLGRSVGTTELAFSIPKRLLGEEEFLELAKAGWNTGHWYTNRLTGELMVEVSTFEHSIR